MTIKERAAELRKEYMRNWRIQNKERVKKYTQDYWERKATEESEKSENGGGENE